MTLNLTESDDYATMKLNSILGLFACQNGELGTLDRVLPIKGRMQLLYRFAPNFKTSNCWFFYYIRHGNLKKIFHQILGKIRSSSSNKKFRECVFLL